MSTASPFAAPVVVLAAAVFATPARGVEPAPGVKLRLMNETPFSLESFKGSAVVLDFRAPWCVPCRMSLPAMDALEQKYEKQGLLVLGLTLEICATARRSTTPPPPGRDA
jgi:thiol-disulfide isomerase/thioredoxin